MQLGRCIWERQNAWESHLPEGRFQHTIKVAWRWLWTLRRGRKNPQQLPSPGWHWRSLGSWQRPGQCLWKVATSSREEEESENAEQLSGYLSCTGCGWKTTFLQWQPYFWRETSATGRREEKGKKTGAVGTLPGSEALMRATWPLSTSLKEVGRKDFSSSFSQQALSSCSASDSLKLGGGRAQSLHHPLIH